MSSASREASARIALASRLACSRISAASRWPVARTSAASSSASRSIALARPPSPAYDGVWFSASSVRAASSCDSSAATRFSASERLVVSPDRSPASWRTCASTASLS